MDSICSDGFTGTTVGSTLAGVTLDNGQGGSASETWTVGDAKAWVRHADGAIGANTDANIRVDLAPAISAGDGMKATARFKFETATTNFGVILDAGAGYQNGWFCWTNGSTVRIRELTGDVGSDSGNESLGTTLTLGTWYRLVAQIDAAGNITAEVTNDAGTRIGTNAATHSKGSAPSNTAAVARVFFGAANRAFMNWIKFETVDAPPAPSSRPAALLMF